MKIAICGSYAFDVIMNFNDSFKHHILPDKVHMLNVAFLVPELRREFGGCAGNIAYNTNLLGLEAIPVATVGFDFDSYLSWLHECGITSRAITTLEDHYTAQAYITTDQEDNQITAFHPGAMSEAHMNNVLDSHPDIAIVSPDGKEAMITHAQRLADAGVPFIFDPGQGLPMFDSEELLSFIKQASWIVVNDYESELLQTKTKLTLAEITVKVEALIVTKGAEGSELHTSTGVHMVPGVTATEVVDPTGCGDSFRAGVLYALTHELSLKVGLRLGNIIGSIKVAHKGTQNHHFTLAELTEIYQREYGETLM